MKYLPAKIMNSAVSIEPTFKWLSRGSQDNDYLTAC